MLKKQDSSSFRDRSRGVPSRRDAAGGAQAAKTVRTVGGPDFERNGFIADSQRFSPGNIVVRPNERVTWVDRDRTRDPHTITFVNRRERPNNANAGLQLSRLLARQRPPSGSERSRIADRYEPG